MTSLKLKANSSGCLGNLNETRVQFQNGISQGDVTIAGADYTKFTASKNTPNMVYKDTFSWEWQVTAANGNTIDTASFGTTAGHTVYVVYAAPGAPWSTAANNTLNPWANVLDYACDWASGEANLADAVRVITLKAHTDFGKEYYGEDTHTVDNNCNLTSLLAANRADCRDMSAVVQLFANVVGVPNNDIKVRRIEGGFQTYPVQPMKLSWQSVWWDFHQVAWYNGSVYDACIRARQSGSYIPAGIDLSYYEMDVRMLLSGSWVPQTPHTITIIQ